MGINSFWFTFWLLILGSIPSLSLSINNSQVTSGYNNTMGIRYLNDLPSLGISTLNTDGFGNRNDTYHGAQRDEYNSPFNITSHKNEFVNTNKDMSNVPNIDILMPNQKQKSQMRYSRKRRELNGEEPFDYKFFAKTDTLKKFKKYCAELRQESYDWNILHSHDARVLKKHRIELTANLSDFLGIYNELPSYSTAERRAYVKSIAFDLCSISKALDNGIKYLEMYTAKKKWIVYKQAKKLLNRTQRMSSRILMDIPECIDNPRGPAFKFFAAQNVSCNPLCDTDTSDTQQLIYEMSPEVRNNDFGKMNDNDRDYGRCEYLNQYGTLSRKISNVVSEFINYESNPGNPPRRQDNRFTHLYMDLEKANKKLDDALKPNSCCAALNTCCEIRSILRNLGTASSLIDARINPNRIYTLSDYANDSNLWMQDLSIQAKYMIMNIMTKIKECGKYSNDDNMCGVITTTTTTTTTTSRPTTTTNTTNQPTSITETSTTKEVNTESALLKQKKNPYLLIRKQEPDIEFNSSQLQNPTNNYTTVNATDGQSNQEKLTRNGNYIVYGSKNNTEEYLHGYGDPQSLIHEPSVKSSNQTPSSSYKHAPVAFFTLLSAYFLLYMISNLVLQ